MRTILKPFDWPITIKVPILVMTLMLAISFVISNAVLSRLSDTQERQLQTLSRIYVDGLSANLVQQILREDVWEVFDTLDRSRSNEAGLNALSTVVLNASDRVIAASDPKSFPTGQPIAASTLAGLDRNGTLLIDERRETARLLSAVRSQGQQIGGIFTELDISALLAERRTVLWQLILTNAALTLFLMTIGYWAVWRMVQPVRTLGDYLDRGSEGEMEIIPDWQLRSASGEFERLFRRYNVMARAANERLNLAERLAKEEKLASLGRLATGIAHEINNPLGGLFNALDALKRYGDREPVRKSSIGFLERGLAGIRDVVRATLMTYRKHDERRTLRSEDIDDLRFLVAPSMRPKGLVLDWRNAVGSDVPVPAAAIRDVALNLLLNACAASPPGATIAFSAEQLDSYLEISVADRGTGLPDCYRALLEQSGGTDDRAPQAGGGIGLWMVRRLLDRTGASISVDASRQGTIIRIRFPLKTEEVRHVA
ncbi:MAG: HAMP domain-containing histidine kinase [Rhodomicrobium sp.]|nr:HAMP domain-containing histidine kinase [Rhodomicrobium sp.]